MLPLAVMGLFLLNNTLFTHTHILPDGRIIVHAHPMTKAGSYFWAAGNSHRTAMSSAGASENSTAVSRESTGAAIDSNGLATGSAGAAKGPAGAARDLACSSVDSQGDTGNAAGRTGAPPEKSKHTHSRLEYTYLDSMSQEFQVFSTLLALMIPMMIIQFYTRHRNAVSHLFGHLPQGRAPPAVV